jgi:midasin (ATPase involved in ribosome maturation)
VKLSKWDLSNYWSLKESSDKSHRKVFKLAKDFEELLNTPFQHVLTAQAKADIPENSDNVPFGIAGAELEAARREWARVRATKLRESKKAERKAKKNASKEPTTNGANGDAKPMDITTANGGDDDEEMVMADHVFPSGEASLIGKTQYPVAIVAALPFVKPMDTNKKLVGMRNILNKSILSSEHVMKRQRLINMMDHEAVLVIDLVEKLKTAAMARKKRSWADALKRMLKLGLSYHRESLVKILKLQGSYNIGDDGKPTRAQADIPLAFQHLPLGALYDNTPPHLAQFTRTDNWDELKKLVAKSELYMYRIIDSRQKMIQRQTAFHKDLTGPEVAKATGYIEHLFALSVFQRDRIGAQTTQYLTLVQWLWAIRELTDPANATAASSSKSTTTAASSGMWSCKYLLDELAQAVAHYRLLYRQLHDVCTEQDVRDSMVRSSAALERAFVTIGACKDELDRRMDQLFPSLLLPHFDGNSWLSVIVSQCHTLLLSIISRVETAVLNEDCSALPFADDSSSWTALVERTRHFVLQLRSSLQGGALSSSPPSPPRSSSSMMALSSPTAPTSRGVVTMTEFTTAYSKVVNKIQQAIQFDYKQMEKEKADAAKSGVAPVASKVNGNADASSTIKVGEEIIKIAESLKATRMASINKAMLDMALMLPQLRGHAQYDQCIIAMRNLVPLLHQTSLMSERSLLVGLTSYRSTVKFSYILLALINVLLVKGFCRKPDEGDTEEGETEDNVAGTGMGEGEGKEDVSDQIDNEEELLGNKEDKPMDSNNKDDKKDEKEKPDLDKGVEMKSDFDGEMHDVPDEEKKEKDDDEKDSDDEEELDREMGDLGEDKNQVDSKLWDDEEDREENDKPDEEKYEKDAPVEQQGEQESETIGREESEQEKEEQKKKDERKKKLDDQKQDDDEPDEEDFPEKKDQPQEEEEDDKPDRINEPSAEEENSGMDPNQFPQDLKLDDEEDKAADEKEDEKKDGDDAEGDDEKKDDAMDTGDDKPGDEQKDDDGKDGEDIGDDKEKLELDEDKDDDNKDDDNDNDQPDREDTDNTIEAPPVVDEKDQQGDGEGNEDEEEEKKQPDTHMDSAASNQATGLKQSNGGEMGKDGEEEKKDDNKKKNEQTSIDNKAEDTKQEKTLGQEDGESADGGAESEWAPSQSRASAAQEQKNSRKPQPKKEEANPYKSMGDATKKWKERLGATQEGEKSDKPEIQDMEEKDDADEAVSGDMQHVPDDKKADAQILAPTDDQVKPEAIPHLSDEKKHDEEKKKDEEDQEMDQEDPDQGKANEFKDQSESSSARRGGGQELKASRLKEKPRAESKDEKVLDDDKQYDPFVEVISEEKKEDDRNGSIAPSSSVELVSPDAPSLSPEQMQSLRNELEAEFAAWTSRGTGSAHALWQRFEVITGDMSTQLCEQLRIILEPMVATKLKGDYRTGKRISIKKVIPYIASQFRKDKIWLRRTKPNKRHYQVMIAIDDSESMIDKRKQGAGRLALEALTVLTRALSQLEVGELAVASFGEKLRLLHAFDQPFSGDSGAFIISQFQFKQKHTLWPQFLQGVVQLLETAKSSSSASSSRDDHLQLVFIVSDAMMAQDRDVIARWAREAMNRRQLLVLLVVDPEGKMTSTTSVTYPMGKMTMKNYLDDFPFPFYIVLKEIKYLPGTIPYSVLPLSLHPYPSSN